MLIQCTSFQSNSPHVCCVLCAVMSFPCSLVVTCWERADLLAVMSVVFCHFPKCSGPHQNQGRGCRLKTGLSPPVKYFTDHFKVVILLWIICVIHVLRLSCFGLCLLLPFIHLPGKSWPFDSCLWCLMCICPFPMWYPGPGVVLDCIDSWSVPSFLLCDHQDRDMFGPRDIIWTNLVKVH